MQYSLVFLLRLKGVDTDITYHCDPTEDIPTIFMTTHASSLDVFGSYVSSVTPVNWIFKKSLSLIPWYGIIVIKGGSIPIDRKNLKSAIESLKKAADQINVEKKKICISPEGTRRRKKSIGSVEQLLPFKKGPFHLAKNSKASIVPIVWTGCYRLSNGFTFNHGMDIIINFVFYRYDQRGIFKTNSC